MSFSRIALIGVGLIGSSLARAIRCYDDRIHLCLADTNPEIIAEAEALKLGDQYENDIREAVRQADLVIFCIPVGSMEKVMITVAPYLQPGSTVSDVGSVKKSILESMQRVLPDHVHAIPGHPVAGTEQSGPSAGTATLFKGRWFILTPAEDCNQQAVEKLTHFIENLGAVVEKMPADHHDLVLAITSHVPHLIAYNIVGTASHLEHVTRSEVIRYSAGGFRDFTRIAASDPVMWRDIFLHNKDAVLEMLGQFQEDLSELTKAIRWGDGEKLFDLFTRTRAIRRNIIDADQKNKDICSNHHHPKKSK